MSLDLKNFLEEKPLLTKVSFEDKIKVKEISIEHLDYRCQNCGKERVFKNEMLQNYGGGAGLPRARKIKYLSKGTHFFRFSCSASACPKTIQFWIEYDSKNLWIRKLGQCPPWDIKIKDEIKDFLGEDVVFLKKGKVCLSQSFGLGACAYLRRVFENDIDLLLDLLIEKRKLDGEKEAQIEKYKQIRNGKVFKNKTELAYKIAPKSLVINGINPFKLIHDFLSKGIHSLTEEECQEKALKISSVLEYVIIELNREKRNRKEFIQKMKAIDKEHNS